MNTLYFSRAAFSQQNLSSTQVEAQMTLLVTKLNATAQLVISQNSRTHSNQTNSEKSNPATKLAQTNILGNPEHFLAIGANNNCILGANSEIDQFHECTRALSTERELCAQLNTTPKLQAYGEPDHQRHFKYNNVLNNERAHIVSPAVLKMRK